MTETVRERLPVSIITGFLGSGKTTLLNRLLTDPAMARSLVIVNEFGEIGIDHLLLSAPSDNMRLIENGCLCCTMRGDLVEALTDARRMWQQGDIPPFDRVIVETTGLADPVSILHTVVADETLAPDFHHDRTLTLMKCRCRRLSTTSRRRVFLMSRQKTFSYEVPWGAKNLGGKRSLKPTVLCC
jgi:G3E family GTPase